MTPATDIRDIHGPIVEAATTPWWPYALAVFAALAVIVMIRTIVRRRRPAVPPAGRAMRELEAARALVESGDALQLATRVSAAVRTYVEDVFDIHAPRRTTEELLFDLMRATSPVAPYRGELGAFLEQCDLVKYARFTLSRADMSTMVDRAAAFVEATRGLEGAR